MVGDVHTLILFRWIVAHRLRTVIDYDRLIVLDKGQVRSAVLILVCIAGDVI